MNTENGLRAVVRELAGQMIEAPTIAVVPVYQQPVERFRMGYGELTLGIEGPAFNLWEALLHFEPEKFPLFVAGEIIHRSELFRRANEWIAGDEAAIPISPEDLQRLKELCEAELRFEIPTEDDK